MLQYIAGNVGESVSHDGDVRGRVMRGGLPGCQEYLTSLPSGVVNFKLHRITLELNITGLAVGPFLGLATQLALRLCWVTS